MFAYIGNETFQAACAILDSKLSSIFLKSGWLGRVITTVKEASNRVAVHWRNPKIGRASVKHNWKGLRRVTNLNLTIVLQYANGGKYNLVKEVMFWVLKNVYLGVHIVWKRDTMLNSTVSIRREDLAGLRLMTLGAKVLLSQILTSMSITLSSIGWSLWDLLDRNSSKG